MGVEAASGGSKRCALDVSCYSLQPDEVFGDEQALNRIASRTRTIILPRRSALPNPIKFFDAISNSNEPSLRSLFSDLGFTAAAMSSGKGKPMIETKTDAAPLSLAGRLRRFIEARGPYQSLALLLVPTSLVEPLKLVAVVVAGDGHWITGTAMIVIAYAASLLFVERLFRIVKPKLLTLPWFAWLWALFIVFRSKAMGLFRWA
jgi:hypothetical protein